MDSVVSLTSGIVLFTRKKDMRRIVNVSSQIASVQHVKLGVEKAKSLHVFSWGSFAISRETAKTSLKSRKGFRMHKYYAIFTWQMQEFPVRNCTLMKLTFYHDCELWNVSIIIILSFQSFCLSIFRKILVKTKVHKNVSPYWMIFWRIWFFCIENRLIPNM